MDQEARILGIYSRKTETTYQDNWCVAGSITSLHSYTGAHTGICFGHQIVAQALGGKCVSNSGKWEAAITDVVLTDIGKRIFGAQSFARSSCPRIGIFDDVFDIQDIQQMHRDHVPLVPPPLHLLGSTTITENQGMVLFSDHNAPLPAPDASIPPIHILTLQGHPEFTAEIVKEIIKVRSESGAMDKETAENARLRADWHNDGAGLIGLAIWRVLAPLRF
jgi:GMP synthase-like glutamine amidotransferase